MFIQLNLNSDAQLQINNVSTFSHNVSAKFCATKVVLLQRRRGTGLIAGSVARQVLKLVGIESGVCKCFGNSLSHRNVVRCLM